MSDPLSKSTSIFGLNGWVVAGIIIGVAIVLLLFFLSLCLTSRRYPSPANPVSAAPSAVVPAISIPQVSKDIQEIVHHHHPEPEADCEEGSLIGGFNRVHVEIDGKENNRISCPARGGGGALSNSQVIGGGVGGGVAGSHNPALFSHLYRSFFVSCLLFGCLSNKDVDSYVLSESSLFVYPCKIIIKTCGTTKLLLSIPAILKLADSLTLAVKSVRFTRGSFLDPDAQLLPHRSFSGEVALLDTYFGKLDSGSKAYLMGGTIGKSQNWHVYSASAKKTNDTESVFSLEMCMMALDSKKASVFFKKNSSSAAVMTIEICDFDFTWEVLDLLDLNSLYLGRRGWCRRRRRRKGNVKKVNERAGLLDTWEKTSVT